MAASNKEKSQLYRVEDMHFTSNIHLCDVDSQIGDVIIELSSEEYYDLLQFDKDLIMNNSISISEENNVTLVLSGIASTVAYEKVSFIIAIIK